jgi:hypothetical protein
MSTSIETKLYQAASVNAGLVSLLGSPFRWYPVQLTEGSAYPAITILRVSGPGYYALNGRMATTLYRIQFTIWEGPQPDDTDSTLNALKAFLDTFSATGITSNFGKVVSERRGFYAETQPGIYQTSVDAMIFNNDNT